MIHATVWKSRLVFLTACGLAACTAGQEAPPQEARSYSQAADAYKTNATAYFHDAMLASAGNAASSPEIIVFSDMDAGQRGQWEEDLRIVDLLIRKSLGDLTPNRRAMGVAIETQQESPLYIEGFGVVLRYDVQAALAPAGELTDQAPKASLSNWERVRRELAGQNQPPMGIGGPGGGGMMGSGMGMPGMGMMAGGAGPGMAMYNADLVDGLKRSLSEALEEAGRNMSGLRDKDQIVVVLRGAAVGSLTRSVLLIRGRVSKQGSEQTISEPKEIVQRLEQIQSPKFLGFGGPTPQR